MPLSIAESGHPIRCGFGKSLDKPLLSRSNIRFSSALNSSCCFRTRLLSVEIGTNTHAKFTAIDANQISAMQQSRSAPQPSTQPAYCITKSKFGLRFRQAQMYRDFPPRVPVLPSSPYLASPIIHPPHGLVDLDRLLQIAR